MRCFYSGELRFIDAHYLFNRSFKDEFSGCLSRWPIPRDPNPQWCVVTWSPDADMIACSDSSGSVVVYDIVGTRICSVESVS